MKILTKEVIKKLESTKPYDGDSSMDAKVIIKLFGGSNCTWLITSAEKVDGDYICYGYANLGYGYEYGPFSLNEIMRVKFPPFNETVERDLHLPKNAKVSDFVDRSNLM